MSTQAEFAPAPPAARPRPTGRRFAAVRIVLGCLLLAAAGLKLYGLNVTAVPRTGWFATPQVQLIAAEWELARPDAPRALARRTRGILARTRANASKRSRSLRSR